jgi:putative heme-binding domain-containing protein
MNRAFFQAFLLASTLIRPASASADPPITNHASRPTPSPSLDLPQEAKSPPLSPTDSLKQFEVADDFEWEQVLAEPLIAQPVFLNFDERGRMWVVEYRQYPAPAGLKVVSHDSVWRVVYDRVPPPPPHHFKGVDRISIHEDSDGDGSFDRHKIFLEGLNIVTSIERGRGGIWVLNPPYLLFYPDANNDDVADRDPEVRLSGFGLEDTHSVANSLRWGPDGWLYGAQGSTVTANILVHGPDGKPKNSKPIYSQGQNIWRYQPDKRIYEVFDEIDTKGRIFSGHNGGDTRGFHYIQGAYLQKGFEKHGPLSNPYAFGYFPAMPHPSVPRFTHNFIIYDHGAFPEQYHGRLFGVEPIQGRIVETEIIPDRSSFRTRDISRPVISRDRWFRPVDIKVGPDGAIYVCDWYDQQINHYRNHEGKIDASNGRIYRLKSKGAKPAQSSNLARLSSSQLLDHLGNSNRWVRQTVLRILADRRDAAAIPKLSASLPQATGQLALEYLWALNLCGGLTESNALNALSHSDPFVRLWTVRLLGDEHRVSPQLIPQLTVMAGIEPNLEVRNQLAATAKRLPLDEALALVRALGARAEDAADNRMPLLVWWALEAQCEHNRDDVLKLFEDSTFWRSPLVESHLLERIARRFAQAGSRQDLLACAKLFELSPSLEHSRRLLAGFEKAFQGRAMTGLPDALVQVLSPEGLASPALALRRADPAAIEKALRIVADETAPRAERLQFLGVMAEMKLPNAVPALSRAYLAASKDDSLRQAILSALQNYDDPSIADVVLSAYSSLGREARASAQTLLASRLVWAFKFVQSLKPTGSSSGIQPEMIPPTIVRKLKQYPNAELRELLQKIWPPSALPTTAEMEQKIHHSLGVIQSGSGDPYAGRTLFQNTCGVCHRLFGAGGQVGPDLTVYDRGDLESMLLAIVNPSAEIREGYENYSVETRDGRSLSGFLLEQDKDVVVLRGLDNEKLTLPRAELTEMRAVGLSLMPEGLLESFDAQQTRDLFAYLRSTQPLVGEPPRAARVP